MPGLVVTTGKWYFEYEFVGSPGTYVQIGVADTLFDPADSSDGVGDDKHSWGFDGGRRCLWNDGQRSWGRRHREDAVYNICLDMDAKVIRFGLDGSYESMGDAFTGFEAVGGLFPAATPAMSKLRVLIGGGHGSPLKHDPPAGFRPLGERAVMPGRAAVTAAL